MLRQLYSQTAASGAQHRASDLLVRPLTVADAGLIDAMHQRLSPTSIYYRYLQYRKPTAAEIATVCQLDPARGLGLVAVVQGDPAAIVGLAYYVREAYAAEPTAEPGILIEDRFQSQGLGRRLWQQLQQVALCDGLRWLRIWSAPENHRMMQLVRGGGFPYTAKVYDGLSEYLVALGAGAPYASKAETHQPWCSTLVLQ
uniref:GCN5-related N-acetyltransferase n=1 Tax=uncultured bacterium A1Q1_fos_493 TaxID=1256577 RepID=L7VXU3_9BACT|nr:GCN5-related N-acetyltransferase [uncultured bacterium A1Q1_fos_493]